MTAYDDVPYDTEANAEAHPRAMATLARLFGVDAAAPTTSATLEIGCGNGEHLVAAATYMPRARFVGFDLATSAIAQGKELAKETPNVSLFAADVGDARPDGPFDFVIAHGLYSWVPEAVRPHVLAHMRAALAPNGIGFLSVNALPGWELRRALRSLARRATEGIANPAEKVARALAVIASLDREPLASAARAYEAHVAAATPKGAPYCRYVFHDLLADINDPFSYPELEAHLRTAGLRIVCETPLRPARAGSNFPGLEADLERTGLPFLQLLVCRDDVTPNATPQLEAMSEMALWADFVSESPGVVRTASGALARIAEGDPLYPAVVASPGFVRIEGLSPEARREVFASFVLGRLEVVLDPPPVARLSDAPCVAPYVLEKARAARGEIAIANALHRSFRMGEPELRVLRRLDGKTRVESTQTLARLARHAFLVETS